MRRSSVILRHFSRKSPRSPPRQRLRPFPALLRPLWPATLLRGIKFEDFAPACRRPATKIVNAARSSAVHKLPIKPPQGPGTKPARRRARQALCSRPAADVVWASVASPILRKHRARAACPPRNRRHPARSRCLLAVPVQPTPREFVGVPPGLAFRCGGPACATGPTSCAPCAAAVISAARSGRSKLRTTPGHRACRSSRGSASSRPFHCGKGRIRHNSATLRPKGTYSVSPLTSAPRSRRRSL